MNAPDPIALDRVADAALALVRPNMTLGLGTGRAAEAFIRRLGAAHAAGLPVRGVATSDRSTALANELGLPLLSLADAGPLDIAFDGADEVTPGLALTKGLGGALLRERVVASEAARFVVLVTPEKLVDKLGSRTPIPVEVVPFAQATVERRMRALGAEPVLRRRADCAPYVTDNRNIILDVKVKPTSDPAALHAALRAIPGVVDTGIFVGMTSLVLVGESDAVRTLGSL